MLATTHMIFGLTAGLLALPYVDQKWYFFLPIVVFGSLLPDIDHEGSKINKILPLTRWFAKFFKHRGFFHSIFPILIIFFVSKHYGFLFIGLPISVGYAAHLFSDSLTYMGIGLLHPILNLRIEGFLRTGGVKEQMLFGVMFAVSAFLMYKRFF